MKYHGKNERTITKHPGSVPVDEKVVSAEPFGNGHINDTLKVTKRERGDQIRATAYQPFNLHQCGYAAK